MINHASLNNKENIFEIQTENRRLLLFTGSSDLNSNRISEISALILNKEQSGNPKELLKVRVKEYSPDKLSYTLLENGITKTIDIPESPQNIAIKKIQNLSLPDLLPKPPESNPIISFLKAILDLVTYPIRYFTKEEHVLSRRNGMASRHTFKATIEFTIKLLESQPSPQSRQIAKKLRSGLAIMDKMQQDAQKGSTERTRYSEESELKNEFIIPIGVGEGKDYIPHFIIVERDKEGKTLIHDIHLSSPSAEKKVVIKTTFTLEQNSSSLDGILYSLNAFIPLDAPPKQEAKPSFSSPFFSWVPGYDYLKSLFEKIPPFPVSENANKPNDSISGVLLAHGAVLEKEAKSELVSTSADPLKLMYELCNQRLGSDPEEKKLFESKLEFYRSWVDASIRSLNDVRLKMSPQERKKALEVLLKDIKSLGKTMAYEYGKEASRVFLSELKKRVEEELDLVGKIKAKELERIRKLNMAPVPFMIDITEPWQCENIASNDLILNQVGGLGDRLDVDFVRIFNDPSPSSADCQRALSKFEEYIDEIEGYHVAGNFNITKMRLLALLKAIPVPSGRHTPDNNIFWHQLDKEGIDRAMKALSRLSNLVWERVMKTWDYPVDPSIVLEMNMALSANLRYLYYLRVQNNADGIFQKIRNMPRGEFKQLNEHLFILRSQSTNYQYDAKIERRLEEITANLQDNEKLLIRLKFRFYLRDLQNQFMESLTKEQLEGLYETYKDRPGAVFNPDDFLIDYHRALRFLTPGDDKNTQTLKALFYYYKEKVYPQFLENRDFLDTLRNLETPEVDLSKTSAKERGCIAKKLNLSREEAAYFVLFDGFVDSIENGLKVKVINTQFTTFNLNYYRDDMSLLYASNEDHERLISLGKLTGSFGASHLLNSHKDFYAGFLGRKLNSTESNQLDNIESVMPLNESEATNYFLDPYLILLKEHNIRIDLINRPLETDYHYRPLIAAIRGIFHETTQEWVKKQIAACRRLKVSVVENGLFKKERAYAITNEEGNSSDIILKNETPFIGTEFRRSRFDAWDDQGERFIYDPRVNNRDELLGAAQKMAEKTYDHNSLLVLLNTLAKNSNQNLNIYESWKLHSLQLGGSDLIQGRVYSNDQSLSIVSIKVSLEFICQYPHLLTQDIVQHRIYNLFTLPHFLRSALLSDPQFFIDIGPKLHEALKKIPETDHLSTLFVQDICGKIQEEVSAVEEYINLKERLNNRYRSRKKDLALDVKISDPVWNGFKPLAEGIKRSIPLQNRDLIHKLFRHQRESNLQKGYAVFLLDQIRQFPPKNVTEWVNVLQAYYILSNSPAAIGHPYIINSILQFMKTTFIPHASHLLREDQELKNAVLNELAKVNTHWTATESLYQFKAEDDTIIDISTGQGFVLRIRDSSDCQLPDTVLSSEEFRQAFGIDFKPRARSTSKEAGVIEYSFEIDEVQFKINFQTSNGNFTINQIQDGIVYKYYRLGTGVTSLKLGNLINEKGTWINTRTEEIYLARHGNLLKNEMILLHFKTRFFKKYLVSASIGVGKNRVWICQDKYRIFMRTLRCCTSHNVLMSTKHDRKRLERIDLPSKLSLIRKEGNLWVQEDKPEMQWWLEDTQFLENEFGPDYLEFMLPMINKNDNSTSYWIYPYKILASGKRDAKLNFLKPADDSPSPEPVKIEKTQKGYKGSHSAFLYMAYYFHMRGEYNKATEYLDLMWKFGSTDKNSIQSLLSIGKYLAEFPTSTLSQRAFLLKAMLNLRMVMQDYSGTSGEAFENVNAETAMVQGLGEVVNKAMKNPNLRQKLSEQGLLLASHEIDELKRVCEVSPGAFIMAPALSPLIKLHVAYPTREEMMDFAKSLENFTISPKTKKIHELHKELGSYPKIDTILTHFWDYVTWISTNDKLKHHDVYFLYNSTPSLRGFENPESIQAIEIARRFLIMLYELKTTYKGIPEVFCRVEDSVGKNVESDALRLLREDVQRKRGEFPSKRFNPNGEIGVADLIQTAYHLNKDHKAFTDAAKAYFRLLYDNLHNNEQKKSVEEYIGNVKIFNLDKKAHVRDLPSLKTELSLPYAYSIETQPLEKTNLEQIIPPVGKIVQSRPYQMLPAINDEWEGYFHKVDSSQSLATKVDTIEESLNKISSRKDNHGEMVKAKVARIKKSVRLAVDEFANVPSRRLEQNERASLSEKLKNRITEAKAAVNTLKGKLVALANENSSGLGIFEDDENKIIECLIGMYQSEFWNGLQDESILTLLDHTMTDFLLASTELQQLNKAISIYKKLLKIDPASKSWEYSSTKLHYYLSSGSNKGRIAKYGPKLYRTFLLNEYKNQIICREKAIQGVLDLLEHKPVFAKIRMGIGKSTFIFPKLAELWLQSGFRPVVVFTEKLLRQSLGYMDPKAYVFSFDRDFNVKDYKNGNKDQIELEHLAEVHSTLQRLESQGRYVVTTPERRAALREKKAELEDNLKDYYNTKQIGQLEITIKKLKLICDICDYFFDEKTRILIDEDENLSINQEFNYSRGEDKEVDKVRSSMAFQIMNWLLIAPLNPPEQFKLLHDLRTKIIQKKVQSLPYHEVEPALVQLAEFALLDERYWIQTVGFTEKQYNKLKEDRSFVKFAMQIKENKEFIVPKNIQKLKAKSQKDSVLKLAVDKLEIFQKQLSETFKSVYKTHPDLRRGIQKASKCVIIPVEGGLEKPNVVFGDEDEIILQHYLFYAVNPPDNDYFDNRFRELSAKDTNGWAEWNATISNGDTPYANISKPENSFHRMMFCRHILEESKSVRVYTHQFVCNSQDAFLEQSKSVASGTGYPFVINMEEPGSAEDFVDSITGETLLGMDFNRKVAVSTNFLKDAAELPNDKNCLGIINQGYSICGNDTKQFAKELVAASKTQRNCVYVESESREKKVLCLGKEPKPLQSDVLNENDFLVLGPRDTRGIDFTLPQDENYYAEAWVGSTTTLDEFEQTLWRLREFGFGQKARIRIDDVMAARITGWSGVPAKEITEGLVVLDIILRTVEDESANNVKAAVFRIKGVMKSRLERAFTKFEPTIKGALVHSAIFDAFKDVFIEDRTKRPSEKFSDTRMLSPKEFLSEIYDQTLTQLGAFLDQAIKNVVKLQEKDMTDDGYAKIKAEVYALCEKNDQKIPTELRAVYKAIKDAEKKLNGELKKLPEWEEYFNKYLPKDNPSNAILHSQIELQILIKVQLKIEQMVHQIRSDFERTYRFEPVTIDDVETPIEPDREYETHVPLKYWIGDTTKNLPQPLGDGFFTFRISKSASTLFGKMNTADHPLFYTLAAYHHGKWHFCVVTQGEWSKSLNAQFVDRRYKIFRPEDKGIKTALYPLFWENTDRMKAVDGDRPHAYSDEFILEFSKLRFILGYVKFNEPERKFLTNWLRAQTPETIKGINQVFAESERPQSLKLLQDLTTIKHELPIDDPD